MTTQMSTQAVSRIRGGVAFLVLLALLATPLLVDRTTEAAVACPPGTERIAGTELCTHGPDPAPPGLAIEKPVDLLRRADARAALEPQTCTGDGVSGMRVQPMYVHGQSTPSRYAEVLPNIQVWLSEIDAILTDNGLDTGGERTVRWVHDASCVPVVPEVVVSDDAAANFGPMITELDAAGYNDPSRVYMIWADANVYCGIGTFEGDDSPGASNSSNTGPSYGRSDAGCWAAWVALHEMGHNLGAVQYSAPNTSLGAHCVDEYDIMCYSDYPNYPPMREDCPDPSLNDTTFDCNHNDYFNANPPLGSYLETHWNTANSVFLAGGRVDPTPEPTAEPTATPDPTPKPCKRRSKKHPCPTLVREGQRHHQRSGR